MQKIDLLGRNIGDGFPAFIIAEMSANHAGDLGRAKEIIHAAKEAGADCIKIQTYTADTLTINCDNQYFKIQSGTWEGQNLYQLYQQAYTPWEWQAQLKEEAEKVGLEFFSTPFDRTAVDFLEEIGVNFYKIASFELVDIPLIEYIASKGKPILFSVGMGTKEEIQDAIDAMYRYDNHRIALLKCSSAYPAIPEEMNLATICDMKKEFDVPVGLSDHSLGSLSAVVAVSMGANVIEKHFCISRNIENPDSAFSMEQQEFSEMVKEIRLAEAARGIVHYGTTKQEEDNNIFRKSIFVTKDMQAGEIFTHENIRVIRPGYGMKPKYWNDILGKKAAKSLVFGTPLTEDMIEDGIWKKR